MKRMIVAAVAGLLLLTSCSTADAPSDSRANAEESQEATTPAVDPGPVELSKEDAGEYYLKIVCQGNVAGEALYNAFKAHEEEFQNGGAPEVETVKAAAAEVVRVDRQQIELFDDEYFIWPNGLSEQLKHLRAQNMAYLATNQSMINAATFEEAYYATYPEGTAEQQAAAQEIRYQLGLDADTTGSCVGFEKANDEVYAEMQERNKLIEEAKATEKP